MKNYLKKIKILFSVIILLLIVSMVGGIFITKDSSFFTGKHFLQTINYLNYKISFAYNNEKNLTATMVSIFSDENSFIKNNNGNAKSIPVLVYHGIIDKPDGFNTLLEDFQDQMFALKKAGWQTISIEDFYKFTRGEKELPDKSFLLTFDDGRKDSYYPVDPILKALNYRATIFIITGHSSTDRNGNYYLSKNELKRMLKNGRWDIQSHSRIGHTLYLINNEGTKGNFFTNKLWLEDKGRIETEEEFKERIFNDFVNSKSDLENELKINVIGFAYPLGDFGENPNNFPEAKKVILNTIKFVYPISFYQIWPGKDFSFNYPEEEQFLIKRIEVRPYWNYDNLLKVLTTAKDKNLPYFDNFSGYNGWVKNYGQLSIENNSMIIESNFSDGGSVFLEGSYLWKNYIFKSEVELSKGQSFLLFARYKDDSNYVSCEFTPNFIRIESIIKGERKLIQEKKGNFAFLGKIREVGIGTENNTIDCYIEDEVVMKGYNIMDLPSYGGVGFKIWDSEINNSKIIIKEVSIEEMK